MTTYSTKRRYSPPTSLKEVCPKLKLQNRVQALIDRMKNDYDNSKNKEERKNIIQEIEKIEEETKFTEAISEATELIFMLSTRLTEIRTNGKRLARKLGKRPTFWNESGLSSQQGNRKQASHTEQPELNHLNDNPNSAQMPSNKP